MIFSEQWVRDWVNPPVSTDELTRQLTMAGLEVDGVTAVASQFSGIVVGEVLSVDPHPDADRLRVCRVSDGKGEQQVVCGAPNVQAGSRYPFAQLGARLSTADSDKPFVIKRAKLRGMESCGMLCSAQELGLEEASEGLLTLPADAPVGQDMREFLALDDRSIELDLTPNRGDCLSIRGLAREIGALNKAPVCAPAIEAVSATLDDSFAVAITAGDACPRYLGRVIRGIDIGAETPLWMREKLRRCGLRSIDPVVDVTNFVLMELGQPMHAFDLGKLQGSIDVRLASDGEKIVLLDGKEIAMTADTLVIADEAGAVAMAGIMGGERTAVSTGTRDVFLECAFFSPLAVAGRARAYGLHTDASHRYERGVDYELQQQATERATQLLLEIVGGKAGPITESTGNLPESKQVSLSFDAVPRFLGVTIEKEQIKTILNDLGLRLVSESETGLTVAVPSFRFDIEIEADLIEELARVFGYNNIPATGGFGRQRLTTRREAHLPAGRVKQHLVSLGYQEVITYSFIDPKLSAGLFGEQTDAVPLQNPISADMSLMRTSLLPGLVATLKYNENRQQSRMRLFETGQVFKAAAGDFHQPDRIAGLVSGQKMPENWCNDSQLIDFYDVKGDIESLLVLGAHGQRFSFRPGRHPALHSGQCAAVLDEDKVIGHLGALHPSIKRELGLNSEVFVFELEIDPLLQRQIPVARPLSRYPEVSRDLALLVDNETPAADILAEVRDNAGDYLAGLRLFDVYQGDALGVGKKSVALGLTWQHPSRTLNDDEINEIIACCIKALEEKFEARLRN